MSIQSIRYSRSNFLGRPSDYVSHELHVCRAEEFWPYLLAGTSGDGKTRVGSAYEVMLHVALSDPVECAAVQSWRTAAGLLAATDAALLTIDEIVEHAEGREAKLPDIVKAKPISEILPLFLAGCHELCRVSFRIASHLVAALL